MKDYRRNYRRLAIVLAVVVGTMLPAGLSSQDIRLGRGDRLEMTVPQRPDLDRRLVIDQSGEVTLPILGQFRLEGMMISEAESALLRALQDIYPSLRQISLSLLGEQEGRTIYVHGEVVHPGKYGFENDPNVWEAVREAGGATSTAALETVRVIRAGGEGNRTFLVNLKEALETGNIDQLPVLQPGDAVIVPESTVIRAGTGSVRVIGAVVTPGPYLLSGDKTLVDAILAAGGPTPSADLRKVTVIRNMPDGGRLIMTFDFKRYLDNGDIRHNPLMLSEDTVNVPIQASGLAVLKDPRFWLAAATAYAAIVAIMQ